MTKEQKEKYIVGIIGVSLIVIIIVYWYFETKK